MIANSTPQLALGLLFVLVALGNHLARTRDRRFTRVESTCEYADWNPKSLTAMSCPAMDLPSFKMTFWNKDEEYLTDSAWEISFGVAVKHHSEVRDYSDQMDVALDGEIVEFDKLTHQALHKHVFDMRSVVSLDYATRFPALNHLRIANQSLDGHLFTQPLQRGSFYVATVRQAKIFNGKPNVDRYDISDLFRDGAYTFNVFFKVSPSLAPSRILSFKLAAFLASLFVLLLALHFSPAAFSKPRLLVSAGLALVTLAYTCPIQLSPDNEVLRYGAYRLAMQAAFYGDMIVKTVTSRFGLRKACLLLVGFLLFADACLERQMNAMTTGITSVLTDSKKLALSYFDLENQDFELLTLLNVFVLLLLLFANLAAVFRPFLARSGKSPSERVRDMLSRAYIPPLHKLLFAAWLYYFADSKFLFRAAEDLLPKLILDFAYTPLLLASLLLVSEGVPIHHQG